MMTAGGPERSLPWPFSWADFDLDLLQAVFPAWRITRMGALIRADREGVQTKFTSSEGTMALVLAGEDRAVMLASQDCRVTGR